MDFSVKSMAVFGVFFGIVAAILLFVLLTTPAPAGIEGGEGNGIELGGKGIEVIELAVADCADCVSFDLFLEQLSDLNKEFEHRVVEFDSVEGKELIEDYNIESVPTIVVLSAEPDLFGNWSEVGSVEDDNVLVFRARIPVYWDLTEKKFVGLVDIVRIVDSSCAECSDPLQSAELQLLFQNIKLGKVRDIESDSSEGKELLKSYHLDFVPAVIFSPGLRDYDFFEQFSPLGSVESDGSFVIREKMPPYKDIDSNSVKGLLNLAMIESSSCWACRDSKDLLEFLTSRLGLRFADVQVFDVNSQAAAFAVEEYAVQFAPAAIISGGLFEYRGMEETFPQIGRVFVDGSYVFDDPLLLGAGYYFDFNSGQIVEVSSQAS